MSRAFRLPTRTTGLSFNQDGAVRLGELYRLGDRPPGYAGGMPVPERIAGTPTGEDRAPRKGEWYLDGTSLVPQCFHAKTDLTETHWLVALVETKAVYNIQEYSPERERGE